MQAIYQQAMKYLKEGKADKAEEKVKLILQKLPSDSNSLSLLGNSLLAQKKYNEAVKAFKKIAESNPLSEAAYIELAMAYLAAKDFVNAEKALLNAVKINPNQCEAWVFLGNIAMQKADRIKAQKYFANAEQNDPFRDDINKAEILFKNRDFHQSEKICRDILKRHPNHANTLALMSEIANSAGATEEAIKILSVGLKHSPFNTKLLYLISKAHSTLAQYSEAIVSAQKLVMIEPENAAFWIVLGGELANVGRNQESIEAYQKAINIKPDMATAHLLLGHVLKISGNREACEKAYHQPLALKDVEGAAYWSLADLKSYRFTDQQLKDMTNYFDDLTFNASQRCQAGFALAKAHEDRKDYALAFKYYKEANDLRPGASFDANEYHNICDKLIKAFNYTSLNLQAEFESDITPIFIVGLPRSGSTLIEQILASHSQIEGTMELYALPNLVRRINILGGKLSGKSYPESINAFNKEDLALIGQSYLSETAIFRQGKSYFIDKLPPNFQQVGLIHKILPKAIVIDARRHPLSCGLSAYKQHFASGHGFSYKLEDIGAYYNDYLRLMDYWNQVLPGKVLTVQYEAMVKKTESQVRKLLTHCGLAFEENCLRFYENTRAVRTASSEQVRQPIYNDSTKQWHNFNLYLEPLRKTLGDSTLSRFKEWS